MFFPYGEFSRTGSREASASQWQCAVFAGIGAAPLRVCGVCPKSAHLSRNRDEGWQRKRVKRVSGRRWEGIRRVRPSPEQAAPLRGVEMQRNRAARAGSSRVRLSGLTASEAVFRRETGIARF